MTTSGVEPATFWLVAQCLNQLRHRVPPIVLSTLINCERMEAIVVGIRYRNLRYAVFIPTKENQEFSVGRVLNP